MINSEIESGLPVRIVLELRNQDDLRMVLRNLNDSEVEARTLDITQSTLTTDTAVTLDLDILTETQRKTLELALTEGYYDRPRKTDLSTLADKLDISKSAVSQRIRSAETKLIRSALEPYC